MVAVGAPSVSCSGPEKEAMATISRRRMMGSVLRVGAGTTVMFGVYAMAPLGRRAEGTITQLVGWLLVLVIVLGWQIRAVIRSPYPRLRAVEAVAVSIPLFLLLFATTYFVAAQAEPASFSEGLTRVDAFYFTVTVFATVGFGDITPQSESARILVTVQMVADLILVGVIAKVLVGVVRQRRQVLATETQSADVDTTRLASDRSRRQRRE